MSTSDNKNVVSVSDGKHLTYGISIASRQSNAQEISEMIDFCRVAADRDLAKYVESIFYDSKACLCSFTLLPSVEEFSWQSKALSYVAYLTIGQYEWFGTVGHKMGGYE